MTPFEKDGKRYIFRPLEPTDEALLAAYFLSLSPQTRALFGPHPLTVDYAGQLCRRSQDSAQRFIALTTSQLDEIVGYFIVEHEMSNAEKERYRSYGINLEAGKDALFAPSIFDKYQNRGIASRVMPMIIEAAGNTACRSLVLMGGTQTRNKRAIAFYKKFGFKRYGEFQTEVANIDMRLIL